jgi:hypothetical protein
VVAADASSVSAIDAGDFCFKAIAGGSLTPSSDSISLTKGQSRTLTLTLRDGGDTIPLPYLPLSCFVSSFTGTGIPITPTITVGTNSDGNQATDVSGIGSVTITRELTDPGDTGVVVRCIGGDASTDISILAP